MTQTILVTGGAGYIGSHTCKLLASAGYSPVCYDNLSTGHREFVKWGELELGDIRDTGRLTEVLRRHAPAAVIHFAGSAYVGESVANPLFYYQNNVGGSLSLVASMRAAGVKNIVFSSSCATYGVPASTPITEDCPQRPISPYGRTKLMVEQILADLAARGEVRQASLRYFNAAGADKDGQIGERHEPETHLIPLAVRAGQGGPTLNVLGTDFPTPDGTAVRDYVHVEDLARAHLLAVEKLLAGERSLFLNLGTGAGNSVREIVDALKAKGLPVKSQDAPRREGDPAFLVADASLARRVLGWEPEYRIGGILDSAIRWHALHG